MLSLLSFAPKAHRFRGRALSLTGLFTLITGIACNAVAEPSAVVADVVSVSVKGESGAYRFAVGIESPDTGCEQYADWWEVVSLDGRLLYRRVLAHSHVAEQPFVRGGDPVPVAPDTVVWVRAHLHPTGYGGTALKGSVRDGFSAASPTPAFAEELAAEPPLPAGCAG